MGVTAGFRALGLWRLWVWGLGFYAILPCKRVGCHDVSVGLREGLGLGLAIEG